MRTFFSTISVLFVFFGLSLLPAQAQKKIEDMALSDEAPSLSAPPKAAQPLKAARPPAATAPAPKATVTPRAAATPHVTLQAIAPRVATPAVAAPATTPKVMATPASSNIEDATLSDTAPSLSTPSPTPAHPVNPAPANAATPPGPVATPQASPSPSASLGTAAAESDTAESDSPGDAQQAQSIWNLSGTFQTPFIRQAMWAGLIVALMCGYLGVYVVLKRIVFVGVALAEMSSAGIALALLLGFAPILGATGFMLIGICLFSIHWSPRRVPNESYIGIVYSIAAAIGILFIAKSAQGETQMLKLLQGDVLTVTASETWLLLGVFTVLAALHALFAKEFLLVSFDREAASTLGFRAGAWDFLLFLTIGTTIAFSIHSTGVLLTSTMLILPAATALLVCNSMRTALCAAPLLGILPVILGLHVSLVEDLPASAVIVALSFLLFLVVLAASKLRK